MKLFAALFVLFSAATSAFAAPIAPAEQVYNITRLPGGTGFDKQIVQLHANSEDFDSGMYFLRIDVRQRKLTNYRLPRATYTNYCGHYRRSGGSIGDYKPKNIYRTLKILHEPTGMEMAIFHFGRHGQDYNETPVVQPIAEFHPRGTRIDIPSDSGLMSMILQKCRSMRPVPQVVLTWQTAHSCRWKPEIWHKPSSWADEYRPSLAARVRLNVVLHCVNL
jgi:hypothetical protein